jgi:hypothetical protein
MGTNVDLIKGLKWFKLAELKTEGKTGRASTPISLP